MIIDWMILLLRVIAPLLLYLFLGVLGYRLLKGEPRRLIPGDILRRLDRQDYLHPLMPETSLGRDGDNTVIIESDFVSGRHATIIYRQGAWWLIDLGSTNGTIVNNTPLRKPSPLHYGDIIQVGDIQFRLEQGS